MKKTRVTPFGRLCEHARGVMAMTRFELAKLVNTSPTDISDIELGKKEPPATYVKLVIEILGMDPDEVYMTLEESSSTYRLMRIAQPKYGSQNG